MDKPTPMPWPAKVYLAFVALCLVSIIHYAHARVSIGENMRQTTGGVGAVEVAWSPARGCQFYLDASIEDKTAAYAWCVEKERVWNLYKSP